MVEEEQRAAAYRAQLLRRQAYEQARLSALAGSPTAAAHVRANWQPLIDARNDSRAPAGEPREQDNP